MTLSGGHRLGLYEIVAPLGAGGMGEVYRARDTKLGREVAVKILPEALAFDPDRVARFEREARTLASLNHPHIAVLHGMEQAEGRHFLIMELVDGETLAERLRRGALPVEQALAIAIQIADALEAAHEKGVVHRDLKPANVKITPDDKVKVLDFGLAKLNDPNVSNDPNIPNVSASPTLSVMATQAGVILGTAAYMSPEQAKGWPADHRSDIFSFGSVLYEMFTGRQPFQGDSAPEMLASVIAREPDFSVLPPNLSPQLTRVLQRCFEKLPKRRWQAIADVRVELEWIATSAGQSDRDGARERRASVWRRAALPAGVALAAAALGAATVMYVRAPAPPDAVVRFSLAVLPPGQGFNIGTPRIAISPDGTRIAYATPGGLYVRSLAEFDATPIVPAAVSTPVFSPDGQSIAYFEAGAVKRIPAQGGTPFTVSDINRFGVGGNGGLSWDQGHLLIGGASAIQRVAASGGTPEDVVPLRTGELGWGPSMLPGSDWALFTLSKGVTPEEWDESQIVVQSLSSAERRVLVESARDARYVASGHLVFARGGVLFAAPFDPQRLGLTGDAVPVLDGVQRSGLGAAAHFSVSDAGSLIYLPGPRGLGERRAQLILADRSGTVERILLPPGPYDHPRVSPDGRRLMFGTVGRDQQVWVYDLDGSADARRLTFGGRNRFPIWSDDGRRVVFQSDRDGAAALYWQSADGSGTAERLTEPEPGTTHIPDAWLPGQDRFLFSIARGPSRTLWLFSVREKTREPFDRIESVNALPRAAAVSPDGKWVASVGSVERTGFDRTIVVQPVPPTGATYQISAFGQHPVWSRDGGELFFVPGGGGRLSAARVNTAAGFSFAKPADLQRAFTGNLAPVYERNYDVLPDGRFVGLLDVSEDGAPVPANQINVVVNWFEELRAKVPTR